MSEILLISDDVVGARMAGPGIRAWEMARVLARRFKVVLAVPDFPASEADRAFFGEASFEVFFYDASRPETLLRRAESARVIVVQGYILSKFPGLRDLDRPIVADIYDPFVLENLFIHQLKIPNMRDREAVHLHDLGVFNELLRRGDHFLVASDRQKDLVTGCLLALGRIGPEALDAGPALDHLLSVVPFGIDETSRSSEIDASSYSHGHNASLPSEECVVSSYSHGHNASLPPEEGDAHPLQRLHPPLPIFAPNSPRSRTTTSFFSGAAFYPPGTILKPCCGP